MKSPWEAAKERRDTGYMQQEKRTGSKKGARQQLNSGRLWFSLRDVMRRTPVGEMLIDNKTTENLSYTIKKDDWAALKRDANRTPPGCHPALQIDIQDLRLMVTEEKLWDDVLDYIRTLEAGLEQLGRSIATDVLQAGDVPDVQQD